MSNEPVVMGSFMEIEPTANALDHLRALGIDDADITIMSSLPYAPRITGRPHMHTRLGTISLVSAVAGLLTGVFFTAITPYLYVIRVGGQAIVPFPPTALLLYEFTMLFLIAGTFGGMMVLNRFPDTKPEYYDPHLTDGRIALVVRYPAGKKDEVVAILEAEGALDVGEPERRAL